MQRTIQVQVLNETNSRVTIKFLSSNSKMPVMRDAFEKRVKDGIYEVVG